MTIQTAFRIRAVRGGFGVTASLSDKFGGGATTQPTQDVFPDQKSAIAWVAKNFSVPPNAWVRASDGSIMAKGPSR